MIGEQADFAATARAPACRSGEYLEQSRKALPADFLL
jgi:hypothetical protein